MASPLYVVYGVLILFVAIGGFGATVYSTKDTPGTSRFEWDVLMFLVFSAFTVALVASTL